MFNASRGAACRSVLAGTAHARAATNGRAARSPTLQPRGSTASPCACPTIRWRAACCARSANRWWRRPPTVRPCVADHRGACARRPARPDRHDPRWRADTGRHRIHHRRLPRSSRVAAARRPRRATRSNARLARHWPTRRPAGPRRSARARHAGLALRAARPAAARCKRRPRRRGAACVWARPAGRRRGRHTLNLSEAGDLVEAAANLFSHLRTLDALNATTIAVMPMPGEGLGEAINDRLLVPPRPRRADHTGTGAVSRPPNCAMLAPPFVRAETRC